MRAQGKAHSYQKSTAILLLLAVLVAPTLAAAQSDASASLAKLKSMAEAQHEIVLLLIKKQEYEKAIAEANKIFDLKWPGDQEPLLLKALIGLSNAFLQQGQAVSSIRMLERNLKYFRNASNQAAIFKEMGYIYKTLKQDDKAYECFKKARDLESTQ